jgi:hypothetical protein
MVVKMVVRPLARLSEEVPPGFRLCWPECEAAGPVAIVDISTIGVVMSPSV